MKRLFAAIAALALLCGSPGATAQARTSTPAPILSAEDWRADLRFLVQELERRHRNLFHTVDRETFSAAVADLDRRIPDLDRNQIIVELMRLVAMVGDGHTNISPYRDERVGFHTLPVRLYLFEDGLHIRAAAPEHADLAGWKVTAFGDTPVQDAIEQVRGVISRDTATGASVFVPVYLQMPEILFGLGLSGSPDTVELTLERGGETRRIRLAAHAPVQPWPSDIDVALETPDGWIDAAPAVPMWLSDVRDTQRIVDLPDKDALYVRLTKSQDAPGRSLEAFARTIETRVEATNPRRLVVDIRLNRGGNGELLPPLVRHLIRSEDEDTRLFLLIGRSTFSAAQFLADDLNRFSEAVLVGEPTGSKPNHYGDSFRIVLPHSGITARASLYLHQDSPFPVVGTYPDVAAPLTFADYAAGRDTALEAALNWRPGPTLAQQIIAAADSGEEAIKAVVDAWSENVANRYVPVVSQLQTAGVALDQAGRTDAALNVLRLATTMFPTSQRSHYLLADLTARTGNVQEARALAMRVLELNADHREARALLDRLPPAD